MKKLSLFLICAACAACAACAEPLHAQRVPVVAGDTVIVTAERSATMLSRSTASVSRLSAADIARLPGVTIVDVLRQIPGFALVNFDGLGFDPQVIVRGFYGAGEAEYVSVLVDGRPVNQVQSGVVSWDALPISGIQAIEVLRGSASALYGDAAVGGVINIITGGARTRGTVSGGSHDTWRGSLALGSSQLSGGGAFDRTEGYRDHAERTTARGNVRAPLGSALTLFAGAHSRDLDEPGPLLSSMAEDDATSSDDLFRFDHTKDVLFNAGLDARRLFGDLDVTGRIGGEYRDLDITRTLALAPGFGDTRARDVIAKRIFGNAQFAVQGLLLSDDRDVLTLGAEASAGMLESAYYEVLTGPTAAYLASSGDRGDLSASGEGGRNSAALFALYALQPSSALRVTLGARYDWLSDEFTPEDGDDFDASHSAFSPKVGVNLRYAERGHVYASASRSFKAPTLDQLFDQRPIPVPFPPFSLTTSNVELVPQHGNSFEGGLYHDVSIGSAVLGLMASAYQIDMRDELDFDVQELKYVNIGRSRHRGIESGVNVARGMISGFANYTLQDVTIQAGDNEGNDLKNIPRHVLNAGASLDLGFADVAASVTRTGSAWIDDANTTELPAWTRVDARVSHGIRGFEIFADVRNVFDERYSTIGFFDPAGTGERYEYPAAGRVFEIGLRR
jgi:iron complex outermembrane recepter protein